MTSPEQPVAIGMVLAGGESSRMRRAGANAGDQPVRKEWLEIGGRTFLDRVVGAVAAETARTIIVAAPGRPLPPLAHPAEIVHDSAPGSGPLAALLDGLDAIGPAAEEPFVFLCSCDVPLVKREVIRLLIARAAAARADWAVPEVAGHPQVLSSVIRRSLRGPIAAWLAAGRRDPRGLVTSLRDDGITRILSVGAPELAAIDPGLESFHDVDTPEELAALARQLPYGADGPGPYTSRP